MAVALLIRLESLPWFLSWTLIDSSEKYIRNKTANAGKLAVL
jgi:hypothetical protein